MLQTKGMKQLRKKTFRIKEYTPEYREELRARFLESFKKDKETLVCKLKNIGMSKGAYSYLLNAVNLPGKMSMESMRAYLEDRTPAHMLLPKDQFWCSGCEEVMDILKRSSSSKWDCKKCCTERKWKSSRHTGLYEIMIQKREYRRQSDPEYRGKYLEQRRINHVKNTYGELYKCMELVNQIKKEMKE